MNFIKRVKRVVKWTPILWVDNDWDVVYMYIILREKLRGMAAYFTEHCPIDDRIEASCHMNRAVTLLTALIDDKYIDPFLKEHNEKWGEVAYKREGPDQPLVVYFPNATTTEQMTQAIRERNAISRKAWELRENDVEELFTLLADHADYWSD